MKYLVWFIYFLPFISFSQGICIIPQPSKVDYKSGFLFYKNGLAIKTYGEDKNIKAIAKLFTDRLFGSKEWQAPASTENVKNIVLRLLPSAKNDMLDESYSISVFPDSLLIQAYTYHGLLYGCESASQLFINSALTYQIPCMEITDAPAYHYRGMHLDVCRHFFSKEAVKQYIDLLAQLKMNVFHWHLTDDQGWRIEIKKYPRLTEVGAWRIEKDGSKYGGFYTQDDIKEIVAYANEKFVTIIPEIEMPGHSSAAIAAYPGLSCNNAGNKLVPNTWGVKRDIYCPSDSTFQFLKDVLDEVCTLFPGKLIHLGGDEVPKEEWKKSATASALIKKENLKNEEELQHYFFKKMEDYLALKGKRCIGWGEIVKGGLSDSVVVMSWLNKKAGVAAVAHGNEVVMTPRFFCYFDYPQSIKDKKQAWWMVYLTLKKVYRFDPQPGGIPVDKRKLILGGQANVWTEYIPDEKQLQHQVMPRLAAMAEALWSRKKDFSDFKRRMKIDSKLFMVNSP